MPQQYSTVPGPTERDAPAESAPAGVKEGQRRSGGGNAHGTLPVPPEAKGDPAGVLNLGGTTKQNPALVPIAWDGSILFSPSTAFYIIKRSCQYGKNDPPDPVRLYGAAAGAPAADGAHHGDPPAHLFPLRLHPFGHPRHRVQRRTAGQGRRRDGKADLPLPEGRQRPEPAL